MATLKERIDSDLKDSMRQRTELRTSVLRMLKSAIMYKEVEPGGRALDDTGVMNVISTMVKQRRDSVEQYTAAARPELADKELSEIAILQDYLPQQLSASELSVEVGKLIVEAGAKSAKDLGSVMKLATARLKGRAEGKAISDEVKGQLSKL
jgi:uncharacterized protein YqeY